MQAKDASRKMPVTASPDTTLASVAKLMNETAVGAVVVVDGDLPVGIVTDRDLVVRALARNLPLDSRVDAVMSTPLVTLGAAADLREALRVFTANAIRRLPLLENGQMVGMVTVDDLLMNMATDLADLVRPITGEVIFSHREPTPPAETS